MKAFFKAVYERVVVEYKTTLIGLGTGFGIIVADQLLLVANGIDSPWAKVLAAVVAAVGAYLRGKKKPE